MSCSESGTGAVTVRLKLLLVIPLPVALMFVLPWLTLCATAGLAEAVAAMVATAALDELQVTCVVMSAAPGFPVAVQLDVEPRGMLAGEQATAIEV